MVVEGTLGFDGIGIDRAEVFRYMGAPAASMPGDVRNEVEALMREAASVCVPRFCWGLFPLEECVRSRLTVGGVSFSTGAIISSFFKDAESCLVYVASSGREFETWAGAFSASGEIVKVFIADSIGSEIAEAASRKMIGDASALFARKGLRTGNSYSPGYCGWNVAEQKKLFSLLPAEPAEVSLTPSWMMSPVKSVSGIVPVGANVRKMPYGCAICKRKDCYKRA